MVVNAFDFLLGKETIDRQTTALSIISANNKAY